MFKWKVQKNNPPPEGVIAGAFEGSQVLTVTNRYERNPALRTACIKHFGVTCQACGFDFESIYGELGKDYCQVHHIVPLAEMEGGQYVDPFIDLIPLCANCHAMIHRGDKVLSLIELQNIITKSKYA